MLNRLRALRHLRELRGEPPRPESGSGLGGRSIVEPARGQRFPAEPAERRSDDEDRGWKA